MQNKSTTELKKEYKNLTINLSQQKSDSSCKAMSLKTQISNIEAELKERGNQYKKNNEQNQNIQELTI